MEFENPAKRIKLVPPFEKLYLNESTADVYFECGLDLEHRERIPAHKLVLCITSDVFKELFATSSTDFTYQITDVSIAAFKEFLQIFYCHDAKFSYENAIQVLTLVRKYQMNDYVHLFRDWLSEK